MRPERPVATAGMLGLVHRGVRGGQQNFRLAAVIRKDRDPDARANRERFPVDSDGRDDEVNECACRFDGANKGSRGEDQDEFITAKPGRGVAFAECAAQAARDLDEHQVPRVMAPGVIHSLEAIEVQKEETQDRILPLRDGDRRREAITKQCSVRKTSERIVQRLVA